MGTWSLQIFLPAIGIRIHQTDLNSIISSFFSKFIFVQDLKLLRETSVSVVLNLCRHQISRCSLKKIIYKKHMKLFPQKLKENFFYFIKNFSTNRTFISSLLCLCFWYTMHTRKHTIITTSFCSLGNISIFN